MRQCQLYLGSGRFENQEQIKPKTIVSLGDEFYALLPPLFSCVSETKKMKEENQQLWIILLIVFTDGIS